MGVVLCRWWGLGVFVGCRLAGKKERANPKRWWAFHQAPGTVVSGNRGRAMASIERVWGQVLKSRL